MAFGLRMPPQDIIDEYTTLSQHLFGGVANLNVFHYVSARYGSSMLAKRVEYLLQSQGLRQDELMHGLGNFQGPWQKGVTGAESAGLSIRNKKSTQTSKSQKEKGTPAKSRTSGNL